jgi:hypothetical protein
LSALLTSLTFNLIVLDNLVNLLNLINLVNLINVINLISRTLVSIRQVLKPSELSGDVLIGGISNLGTELARQHWLWG